MRLSHLLLATTLLAAPAPATAQDIRPAANSAPAAVPIVPTIPPARDARYPGTIAITVDATDTARGIIKVRQTIPVAGATRPLTPEEARATSTAGGDPAPGMERITLLYPQWLPGHHSPRNHIAEIAGLTVTAGGRTLPWTRDPVDVQAFHIDLPAGTAAIDVGFDFLTPTRTSEGRVVVTPAMANLQFVQTMLYPAGFYTRAIPIRPTILLPQGWTGAAALDGLVVSTGTGAGGAPAARYDYAVTNVENFADSPMFAGAHFAKWDLGANVTLNVVADEPGDLLAKPEQIEPHKALVREALALFGGPRFDRYEFLVALTDELGGIGLEHHRSSENSFGRDLFTDWDKSAPSRGLLPHEMTHSWNGKHRRPARLWTPDYRTPMQDNLLWVYEGQTSYWDGILSARSGLQSRELVLADLARAAANYDGQRGRAWRSVEDTTFDPVTANRKPRPFPSWSRGEDYYIEGSLVWLEADMLIRRESGGKRSLDDFARAFFGGRDGDYGQRPYEFEDVVAALNGVHPHDWATFLTRRIRTPGQPAPLAGIEAGGYRLVWKDEPNIADKAAAADGVLDARWSLGFSANKEGVVGNVLWDGPAFRQGIVNGTRIVAVNGLGLTAGRLTDALKAAAKSGGAPVELLVERGGRFRTVRFDWTGGPRWPHLEPIGTGPRLLDAAMAPIAAKAPARRSR